MKSRGLFWLIGTLSLALLVHLYLIFVGSAVVVDETGGVISATVTNSDPRQRQALTRLWDGYFYAIPDMEGVIEIRCRDGTIHEQGYVTGNMHTKIRVVGNRPCERFVETG